MPISPAMSVPAVSPENRPQLANLKLGATPASTLNIQLFSEMHFIQGSRAMAIGHELDAQLA